LVFAAQNLGNTGKPYLVTLNPSEEPRDVVNIWRTSHPIPSPAATKAIKAFGSIQGKRGIWFCGAYQGVDHHPLHIAILVIVECLELVIHIPDFAILTLFSNGVRLSFEFMQKTVI